MSSAPTATDGPLGRTAVLGLGLIGGSVARGISGLGLARRVVGWSPQSTERDAALTAGALTFAAADWRDAVREADLVIVAVPPQAALALIPGIAEETGEETTLTDVTSLKAAVEEAARDAGLSRRWVGGHPMAGSEASGFWASRADLFQDARVWLVPGEAESAHRTRVERLWKGLGARPAAIDAEAHDRLMAMVSHLPQVVASALASVLMDAGVERDQLGPGARDMTRLAFSDPIMWSQLLAQAPPELSRELRILSRALSDMADHLDEKDGGAVESLLRKPRGWRERR